MVILYVSAYNFLGSDLELSEFYDKINVNSQFAIRESRIENYYYLCLKLDHYEEA